MPPPANPVGGTHSSFFCPQMKGPIDVENCCLVISYIPLSSISAVLLLHLWDTAEKSLLCTIEATGLKFHCWRGRLRRNKSGFNTTNSSNYQMWAERIQKTRRDRKALGILQSFPFRMKVLLWGFQGRKPGQPAHLEWKWEGDVCLFPISTLGSMETNEIWISFPK